MSSLLVWVKIRGGKCNSQHTEAGALNAVSADAQGLLILSQCRVDKGHSPAGKHTDTHATCVKEREKKRERAVVRNALQYVGWGC